MRALGPILGRYRGRMLAAIALAVVSQVFLALGPLVQSVILDDAVLADERPLAPWIALLIAVGVVSFVTNYGRRRLGGRAAVDVQRDLQVAVHHHMQYLDPAWRDQLRAGDIMSRATSDITLIQVFLQQLAMSIGSIALLASSLVIMLFLSPLLAVVVGVCVPLFAWLSNRFRTAFVPRQLDRPALSGRGRRRGGRGGHRGADRQGVRAGAGRARPAHRHGDHAVPLADAVGAHHGPLRRGAAGDPDARQLGVLAFGGWLAIEGRISLGVLLAFASYVVQLVAPVRLLAGVAATSQQARAGAHRVLELLAVQPAVRDAPDARAVDGAAGAARRSTGRPSPTARAGRCSTT